MKAKFKMKQLLLSGAFMAAIAAGSLSAHAQSARAVYSDPRLGVISFTDALGYQLDESYVQPNELIRLKIPVINDNHGQPLPAGSCKIKIGLGSKLVLDPAADLNNTAMSNYFRWTFSMNGGQQQVTGELIAPLPAGVDNVTVAFRVKGAQLGKSTITANFLVTNHNTVTVVSDEDGTNNAAFLPYTVSARQAPVAAAVISAVDKEACNLLINFATERERELARYEVELSRDAVSYERAAVVNPAGKSSYTATVELSSALQAASVFVRIKSVDRTGRVVYSNVKQVNGFCKQASLKLAVYPNPVHGVNQVTISTTQGYFDGKYKVKLLEMGGKLVSVKEITVSLVNNFSYELGNIAAGKYLIQLSNADNETVGLLRFEKL